MRDQKELNASDPGPSLTNPSPTLHSPSPTPGSSLTPEEIEQVICEITGDCEPQTDTGGNGGQCTPPPSPPSNTDPNCGEFPQRDPRPEGDIDESEADLDDEDRRIAEILRNEGYQVKKLRVRNIEGQSTPDFEVIDPQTGVVRTVEVKQPTINNPETIRDAISKSLEFPPQSDNIIIDGSVGGVTRDVALQVLREVRTRLKPSRFARLNSLRIIGDDFDVSTKYPDDCL